MTTSFSGYAKTRSTTNQPIRTPREQQKTEDEVNQAMDKVWQVEALDKLPVRWGELKRM